MTASFACNCGAHLGEIVTIKGLEVLKIDNSLFGIYTATCAVCGVENHFNAMGRKFNKTIKDWRATTRIPLQDHRPPQNEE